jgi:hypothetical protein
VIAHVLGVATALTLVGCVAPSVDLSGKHCPCGDGYACGTDDTCLALGGAIQVSNLRAAWSTPNQIRWNWDASGDPEQFREYQILVATSQAALDPRDATTATRFSVAQNPELDHYLLPRTGGEDQVLATTTDLLQPSTLYFAQLLAIDALGRASLSNTVSASTTDPAVNRIVIFEDQKPAGYTLPGAPIYALSNDRPFEGTSDFEYVALPPCTDGSTCGMPKTTCDPCCAPGSTACNQNLRFHQMGLSLNPIGGGTYAKSAYLEFALASDATVPSYWGEAYLWYGDGSANSTSWSMEPLTYRADDQYRVIQVPLRVFAEYDGSGAFVGYAPYCQLVAQAGQTCTPPSTGGLFGFNVGGLWTVGAKVRIDSIRIYY